MQKQILGKKGEELAAKYLFRQGYKIIERNFQKRYGEIDIVALNPSTGSEKTLVFVEVKTRTTNEFGNPAESITPWKLKSLVHSAYFYKSLHPELPEALRIDVVSVELSPGGRVEKIELIKNVTG